MKIEGHDKRIRTIYLKSQCITNVKLKTVVILEFKNFDDFKL